MKANRLLEKKETQIGILAASVLFALFLFIWVAYRLDLNNDLLAFDWKNIWGGIQGGHVHWGPNSYHPPWTVLLIFPLGFLPMQVGWGVVAFLTAAALIVAVPRGLAGKGAYLAVVLAAVLSFPALRNYADGNLNGLLLIGLLLIGYGYREEKSLLLGLGVLLAATKPQASLLLLVVLVVYLIQTKPFRFYLQAGIFVLAVVLVSFLVLPTVEWFREVFGVVEETRTASVALSAFLANLAVPPMVSWALRAIVAAVSVFFVLRSGDRELSHLKIALLIAGSLLVAPYAGGLTLVVVMAFGVIPLMLTRPVVGIALYVLYMAPFFALRAAPDFWKQAYWTLLLLATWTLFVYLLAASSSEDDAALPLTESVPDSSPS
jgi:hypothetical protein